MSHENTNNNTNNNNLVHNLRWLAEGAVADGDMELFLRCAAGIYELTEEVIPLPEKWTAGDVERFDIEGTGLGWEAEQLVDLLTILAKAEFDPEERPEIEREVIDLLLNRQSWEQVRWGARLYDPDWEYDHRCAKEIDAWERKVQPWAFALSMVRGREGFAAQFLPKYRKRYWWWLDSPAGDLHPDDLLALHRLAAAAAQFPRLEELFKAVLDVEREFLPKLKLLRELYPAADRNLTQ